LILLPLLAFKSGQNNYEIKIDSTIFGEGLIKEVCLWNWKKLRYEKYIVDTRNDINISKVK
jgi:hypothetical protein